MTSSQFSTNVIQKFKFSRICARRAIGNHALSCSSGNFIFLPVLHNRNYSLKAAHLSTKAKLYFPNAAIVTTVIDSYGVGGVLEESL